MVWAGRRNKVKGIDLTTYSVTTGDLWKVNPYTQDNNYRILQLGRCQKPDALVSVRFAQGLALIPVHFFPGQTGNLNKDVGLPLACRLQHYQGNDY